MFFLSTSCFLLNSQKAFSSPLMSLNAKASSLGNAVTAESVGTASTSFNPATLTLLKTGKTGRIREYKLLATQFPSYKIEAEKPATKDDPFLNQNVFINDCVGSCLFGEEDPRDTPWEPVIDRLAVYIPKYGEIDLDPSVADFILLPLMGSAYRPAPHSPFIFTSSLVLPMGGVHFKEEPWNIKPTQVSFGIIGFAPSMAYRISPHWSIGGGVQLSMAGAKLGLDYRLPSLFPSLGRVLFDDLLCPQVEPAFESSCASDRPEFKPLDSVLHVYYEGEGKIEPRFNIGLLWEPTPWFRWGIAYKNKITHKLTGDGGILLSEGLHALFENLGDDVPPISQLLSQGEDIPLNVSGKVEAAFPMPAHLDTGISLQLTSRIRLNIDYKWKENSVFNDAYIAITEVDHPGSENIGAVLFGIYKGNLELGLPQVLSVENAKLVGIRFKDSSNFSYGLTYRHNNRLTLRAGFENKSTPIDTDQPVGVLGDISFRGLGFNYQWDANSELDVTYVQFKMEETAAAGESFLTSASLLQPIAFWAGQNLHSRVSAHLIQVGWTKRL